LKEQSMIRRLLVGLALVGFFASAGTSPAWAKGSRGNSSPKSASHPKPSRPAHVKAEKPKRTPSVAPARSVPRNEKGRIQRSAAARHAFARQTGHPNGRPGYVIDHIKPLACGGADAPSNMQWQTVAAAKAKDKVERVGCR
jgi:hypothetical protein